MQNDTRTQTQPGHVAVLWGADGPIFGMRLCAIRDEEPAFHSATPAELWSAVHQAGLTISVRWVVMPASTVGAPGHLEVYLLVQGKPAGSIETLPDELRSLLVIGFPRHRFAPISEMHELLFALAPFGQWAWTMALGPDSNGHPAGDSPAGSAGGRATPLVLNPAQAEPAKALALLATARVASMLEVDAVALDRVDRARLREPDSPQRPGQRSAPVL